MSILSWNCRGLGRTQDLTVQRLREFRRLYFPEIMFLMETKNCRNVLVDLQEWLGYDRVFTVDPRGLSGGLALFWKSTIKLDIKYADKNLIDMQVQFGEFSFFLSCIYGEPAQEGKSIVWERLSRIGVGRKEQWCLVGDFNEILNNNEKLGGPARAEESFQPFGDMLSACGMEELESSGDRFTWSGQRWKKWIQCCLDRAFGNKEWLRLFPGSNQKFLDKRGSDHRPVLLNLRSSHVTFKGQFRFDKKFIFLPVVKKKIQESWSANCVGAENRNVSKRLRDCRGVLSRWKKSRVFNARDRIHLLEHRLEWFESRNYPCFHAIRVIKKELYKAYREEEIFWQQRSRERWLRHGDRNSKFFHDSVKSDHSRKLLSKIKDINGIEQWSEAAKAQVAVDYFSVLFKSSNPSSFQLIFQDMAPRVTASMNERLVADVSCEEIREAVFSIKASSAPGPDGMTGLFFHQYWDIVGPQVTAEVQKFLTTGVMPEDWNFTHICLLPKVQDPELMSDLRPISLCSVLYKIISKVMVRRLQPLLPDIISVNQSAFVAERLITDNIGIAHEVVHALRSHHEVEKEFMVVKTDMSKAYDRIEWSYLRRLMETLGFDQKWVCLVLACVSSVSFAVLINDQPFGLIKPQRGIRQGDPLSPFLFVLCTEGLTHMLNKAERDQQLCGVRFSEHGPSIHHLLFADDSLFMCKASVSQARVLHDVLRIYEKATGQAINVQKSAISFGRLVGQEERDSISQVLGIFNEGGSSKYLGLPECFSGSKVDLLGYLRERVTSRLNAWYLRKLSQGGKEILLKVAASAMPVFAMSVYKLPKTVCAKIVSVMADFWWGSDLHKRKVHWIAWDKLCLPKEIGGMGFRDFEAFNQALLAKQAWKVLSAPQCLLARFLKSRYFPEVDFLEAKLGNRPSYGWRSLLFGRDLLVKGLRKRVGDGNSINVWCDKWFEDDRDGFGLRAPWIKNCTFDLNLKVRSLIDFQARRWNHQALEEIFVPSDIEVLLRNQPVVTKEDFWVWKFNRSGAYTVKSGYWLASNEKNKELRVMAEAKPSLNDLKMQCWKVHTSPKIRLFLWKALSDARPVSELLLARGMKCDERCQVCGREGESTNHVLFQCDIARQTWALSDFPTRPRGWLERSIYENTSYMLSMRKRVNVDPKISRVWPWILWYLWKHRNGFLFEGKSLTPEDIASKAYKEADE